MNASRLNASQPSILVAGEMLIDLIPESAGPLADVESFTRRAGGAPANVAVALSALDRVPAVWTRVGDDPFGDHLVETLAENGVPLNHVERDPEARTSLAFVTLDDDADRSFTFYRDGTADTRLSPDDLPAAALETAEWVHVGGVTLADEPSRSATMALAERAVASGCTVSFDPNARPELWDEFDYGDSVDEMLSIVDVLKATPEDLRAAGFEADDPTDLARDVCDRGPHTTLLTLGPDGAVAHATADAPWPGTASHPGFPVDAVDTTGAGDAFTAGAVAALSEGESLSEALAFAGAVAAVTTTRRGAMAALPDREAVSTFRAGQ